MVKTSVLNSALTKVVQHSSCVIVMGYTTQGVHVPGKPHFGSNKVYKCFSKAVPQKVCASPQFATTIHEGMNHSGTVLHIQEKIHLAYQSKLGHSSFCYIQDHPHIMQLGLEGGYNLVQHMCHAVSEKELGLAISGACILSVSVFSLGTIIQ